MDKYIKLQKNINGKNKYTVTPNLNSSFILPETIIHIGEIAKKYDATIKIGTNQKISIINIKEENLDFIIRDLNMDLVPKGKYLLTNITVCTSNFCRMSKHPTIGIYMKIINNFSKIELPAKTKIGISSCKNSCVSAYVKDIGILVDNNGKFFIVAGGRAGDKPQCGYQIASNLSENLSYTVFKNIINYYIENAEKNEKLRSFIDRVGLDNFKSIVLT